jgi:hypothetical protein
MHYSHETVFLLFLKWYIGPKVSSTNTTDRHDIPEILLKVTLNTITLTRYPLNCCEPSIHSFWRIDGKCKSNNKYNSHVITFENCCHILFMVSLYYKWRSVVLVEETLGPGENHRPVASHWQTLSHNVVLLALVEIRTHNISGNRHWFHM